MLGSPPQAHRLVEILRGESAEPASPVAAWGASYTFVRRCRAWAVDEIERRARDGREVTRLGGEEEVGGHGPDPLGPQAHLGGGLLAGDVQDRRVRARREPGDEPFASEIIAAVLGLLAFQMTMPVTLVAVSSLASVRPR